MPIPTASHNGHGAFSNHPCPDSDDLSLHHLHEQRRHCTIIRRSYDAHVVAF